MMRAIAAALLCAALTGCAGLSVDWAWSGQAVYRSSTAPAR